MWNDRYSRNFFESTLRDPATLAIMSIGSSVAGGAISAGSAIYGGFAKSSMYNYQAQVATMNKQIAERNASYAVAVGEVNAQRKGMETRARVGQTEATQGASGLEVGSGTNAEVVAAERDIGSFDQMTIRAGAERESFGFKTQAMNFEAEAQADKAASKYSKVEGFVGAASSIVGGASSVSDKWLKYGTAGVPGFA